MKVLFLDVDGVLNTTKARTSLSLSRGCLGQLQAIVVGTGCELVLSSTWRLRDNTVFGELPYKKLMRRLAVRGMALYGVTPRLNAIRGVEIQYWLNEQPVERYAIVDDDSDMLCEQLPNFFQTDPDYGLTKTIAYRIIYHLNDH